MPLGLIQPFLLALNMHLYTPAEDVLVTTPTVHHRRPPIVTDLEISDPALPVYPLDLVQEKPTRRVHLAVYDVTHLEGVAVAHRLH